MIALELQGLQRNDATKNGETFSETTVYEKDHDKKYSFLKLKIYITN